MKVLVVEDEPRVAQGIEFVLASYENITIETRHADTYAATVDAVREFQPDFAIVDVSVIAVDRRFIPERLEKLFASLPSCKIVLVSAQDEPPLGYDVQAPNRLWLAKPFGRVLIAQALEITI